jgi:hypothetical protein
MEKIHVASSWRNQYRQMVAELLRKWGHEVYDFKNCPLQNRLKSILLQKLLKNDKT